MRRILAISALVIAALAAMIASTWPAAPFAIAALTVEKPPEILLDFDYPERMESIAFAARFKAGTAESKITDWLKRNDFEVVRNSAATRKYAGFPCTYTYHVEWQSKGGVLHRDAVAHLTRYACL